MEVGTQHEPTPTLRAFYFKGQPDATILQQRMATNSYVTLLLFRELITLHGHTVLTLVT